MSQATQLKTHVVTGREPGPHLLITGGVHGDEFEPMVAIRRLVALPEMGQLRGTLTLVPVVNEGALARGHRTADDGLDLARTCPGRPDGTITEQTAHALSTLIRAADYYIDLHTGGTCLSVWPMAGYVLHPRADILDQQRRMARAFNLPVVWGTDPTLPGRSLSVARDAGVPAIYTEYLGGAQLSEAGVRAYVTGCLNVLGLLKMLDRLPPPSAVEWVVEDPRPHSGHMQRCYPAPTAGCFEAAVELGQPISPGQPLGCVVDPLGRQRHEVLSQQSGRILVLRTFPAVQPGDSLAVILEPV
ncbi:MAG: M14 family metallopeptidase [Pirellulaceae bacterium]|nr:M14 family metallopeptidase [Pirellulaceae bacterium]